MILGEKNYVFLLMLFSKRLSILLCWRIKVVFCHTPYAGDGAYWEAPGLFSVAVFIRNKFLHKLRRPEPCLCRFLLGFCCRGEVVRLQGGALLELCSVLRSCLYSFQWMSHSKGTGSSPVWVSGFLRHGCEFWLLILSDYSVLCTKCLLKIFLFFSLCKMWSYFKRELPTHSAFGHFM